MVRRLALLMALGAVLACEQPPPTGGGPGGATFGSGPSGGQGPSPSAEVEWRLESFAVSFATAPVATEIEYAISIDGTCVIRALWDGRLLASTLQGRRGRLDVLLEPDDQTHVAIIELICEHEGRTIRDQVGATIPPVPDVDVEPAVAEAGVSRTVCWDAPGATSCGVGILNLAGQVVAGIAADEPGASGCRTFLPEATGQVAVACNVQGFDVAAAQPLVVGTGPLRFDVVPAALTGPGRVVVDYEVAGGTSCGLYRDEDLVQAGALALVDVALSATGTLSLRCDGAIIAEQDIVVGPAIQDIGTYIDRSTDEVTFSWRAPGAVACSLHATSSDVQRTLSELPQEGERTVSWDLGDAERVDINAVCFGPGVEAQAALVAPVPQLHDVQSTPTPFGAQLCYSASGLVDATCAVHQPGVLYLYPLPESGCADAEIAESSEALLYCSGSNGYVAEEVFLDVTEP